MVLFEKGLKVFATLRIDEIGRIRPIKRTGYLAIKIDAIDNDHHRRVLKRRVQT